MALRVLLADESNSIKKVMQLALQDFAVEVKAVPVGVDVVSVAKTWQPDIFFVDVLLAKRSGYDVSADIKKDPILSNIPVVLMWSGFMDLDEKKTKESKAERTLEKPFDTATLRGIIKDLIPMTQGNEISNYLTFPNLPDFVEGKKENKLSYTDEKTPEVKRSSMTTDLDQDEPEAFIQTPLPHLHPKFSTPPQASSGNEQWATGNLDRFKINLPKEDISAADPSMSNIMDAPILLSGQGEVTLGSLDTSKTGNKPAPPKIEIKSTEIQGISPNLIDPAMVEHVLREQVKAVLQDIAWKIIPDVAERVIKEEINKLLKDAEKL